MSIPALGKPEPSQFSPPQMMEQAEIFAMSKTSKPTGVAMGLAIMAGIFISLAFVFYTTVTTGNASLGWGLNRLIGGLAFSLGLILIVVCGGELFTSTVLSLINRVNGQISTSKLVSTWAKVFVGNFIGAAFLVALVMGAQLYANGAGQWGLNALNIAQHKLHHSPLQAFSLGVLCNMLVCLAIWMTFSTKNIGTKAMLMMMPVALFVSSGFEHCIANLFMVPLGIAIQSTAGPEFWLTLGVDSSVYADLTWGHFIVNNLIPVTIGNIVGGAVVVGLGYRTIFRTLPKATATSTATVIDFSQKFRAFALPLGQRRISDIMDAKPLLLRGDQTVAAACAELQRLQLEGAVVVDANLAVIGYFSHHDVMVDLWRNNYQRRDEGRLVQHVMSTEVTSINGNEMVLTVAEQICIAPQQLYPVNQQGALINPNGNKQAPHLSQYQDYPVVVNQQVVGRISRLHIASVMQTLFENNETQRSLESA
ncbi:formate transporter FocA [Ferrimonas lipolytica]|uniref:Formate transporter FocA n=1 Tax=Ferrimonas lipolytica TaxID=2724191 RepID=A0A6H1UKE1_9GAMM|nr:formate transporter FocA [Ferrimonas lipolytica]QIZ78272.1 formate transporter FocA [Ferrimonas lipolytica]